MEARNMQRQVTQLAPTLGGYKRIADQAMNTNEEPTSDALQSLSKRSRQHTEDRGDDIEDSATGNPTKRFKAPRQKQQLFPRLPINPIRTSFPLPQSRKPVEDDSLSIQPGRPWGSHHKFMSMDQAGLANIAQRHSDHAIVAIKEYRKACIPDDRSFKRTSAANIVNLLSVFSHEGVSHFVYEWVDVSLRNVHSTSTEDIGVFEMAGICKEVSPPIAYIVIFGTWAYDGLDSQRTFVHTQSPQPLLRPARLQQRMDHPPGPHQARQHRREHDQRHRDHGRVREERLPIPRTPSCGDDGAKDELEGSEYPQIGESR